MSEWEELEFNEITNGSCNRIWFVDWPSAIDQSLDDVSGLSRNESGEGGKSDDRLGEHFRFFA